VNLILNTMEPTITDFIEDAGELMVQHPTIKEIVIVTEITTVTIRRPE